MIQLNWPISIEDTSLYNGTITRQESIGICKLNIGQWQLN